MLINQVTSKLNLTNGHLQLSVENNRIKYEAQNTHNIRFGWTINTNIILLQCHDNDIKVGLNKIGAQFNY